MYIKLEVRSFTLSWDNRGNWKIFGSPQIRPRTLFFPIFKGLLFAWTLWIYLPNLRSFTPFWDNRGYSKNFGSPRIRPRSLLSLIFKGLLFAWTLWIRVPNLKFVPLPVRKIIGGTEKITAVPWCTHAPFSPKFLRGFCSHRRCECTCQIWNL